MRVKVKVKPQEVTQSEANDIILYRKPLGLFYHQSGAFFVGIDNRTGDAWTEDFPDKESCVAWLLDYPED